MTEIAWPSDVWVDDITMALGQPHKQNQITDDGVVQQTRRGASRWHIRTSIASDNRDTAVWFFNAVAEANCVVQMPLNRVGHGFRTLAEAAVANRIYEDQGLMALRMVTPDDQIDEGMYLLAGTGTFKRIYQVFSVTVDGANTIVRVGPNIRPRGTAISPLVSIAARLAVTGPPPWGRIETIGKKLDGDPLIRAAPFNVDWYEVPG